MAQKYGAFRQISFLNCTVDKSVINKGFYTVFLLLLFVQDLNSCAVTSQSYGTQCFSNIYIPSIGSPCTNKNIVLNGGNIILTTVFDLSPNIPPVQGGDVPTASVFGVTDNRGTIIVQSSYQGNITTGVDGRAIDLQGYETLLCIVPAVTTPACQTNAVKLTATEKEQCLISEGFPFLNDNVDGCAYDISPDNPDRAVSVTPWLVDLNGNGEIVITSDAISERFTQVRSFGDRKNLLSLKPFSLILDRKGDTTASPKPSGYVVCYKTEVVGGWTEWSEWSDCGDPCSSTKKTSRNRQCTNPAPSLSNDILKCKGDNTEEKQCTCSNGKETPPPPTTTTTAATTTTIELTSTSSSTDSSSSCLYHCDDTRCTFYCLLIFFLLGTLHGHFYTFANVYDFYDMYG